MTRPRTKAPARSRAAAAALAFASLSAPFAVPAEEADGAFVAAGFSRTSEERLGPSAGGARVYGRDSRLLIGAAPVHLGRTRVRVGVDYAYSRFVYANVVSRDRDLHRLALPVAFSRPAGERGRLRFDGFLAPGISTSSNVMKDLFDRGSSDDLQLAGRLEARTADGTAPRGGRWILGLGHDRTFGESKTYPVIGVGLNPAPELDVRLAWPDSSIVYRHGNRHRLSAWLFPAGHQWHVTADDFQSEFPYRFEAWRAEGNWNLHLFGAFSVDLSLGYAFDQRHEFTGDLGQRLAADAEDAWFFALGVRVGSAPLPLAHGAHFGALR